MDEKYFKPKILNPTSNELCVWLEGFCGVMPVTMGNYSFLHSAASRGPNRS